jgi:N-acetylneuraminic acid mutarotase
MRNFLYSLALTAGMITAGYSNYWIQKPSVGVAGRADAAGCSINGKGYLGTGFVTAYTKDWWEYDTLTNMWTQKADFAGSPTVEAACVAIVNKAYFLPFATNDFYCYDPQMNTWSLLASFPGPTRQGAIAFSIDAKGYFGLGASPTLSTTLDDLWEYDPQMNVWTQKSSLPAPSRMHAAAFAIGPKGYVGTGLNNTAGFLDDFWEYDPTANAWTQRSNFPGGPRYEGTGFAIGNYGFMGGGYGIAPQPTFWRYDPSTDSWSPIAPLPAGGRVETVTFSIGKYGFLGTGWDGFNFLNDFWMYSPDSLITDISSPSNMETTTMSLYPNPACHSVFIHHEFPSVTARIFDLSGRLLKQHPYVLSRMAIHVENLPAGTYIIQVDHPQGTFKSRFRKCENR